MDYYVARQPIFDLRTRVFGYELLYRSGARFGHLPVHGDVKTLEVINNSFMLIGFEQMTRGRKAFVNFTRSLLEQDVATILPPQHVVIEILEDIEPDDSVLKACRHLKKMGYTIALDDFVYDSNYEPFLEVADIIKVDFRASATLEERRAITRISRNRPLRFLAEKVETKEEVEMAIKLGYVFLQGYFYEKPVLMVAKDIPPAKHVYFKLLQEVNKPDLDMNRIESLIEKDPSLMVKLLRFINSAAFGLRNKVSAIRQALVLLGPIEVRKWISIVVMHGISSDKTDELIVKAISRAYQCEQYSRAAGMEGRSSALFLMGLLSLIDVMLERPMDYLMEELFLEEDIKSALTGKAGKMKDILDMVVCYERGNWEKCEPLWTQYFMDGGDAGGLYLKSLDFASQLAE